MLLCLFAKHVLQSYGYNGRSQGSRESFGGRRSDNKERLVEHVEHVEA
jgi:hypothetical protein